MTISIAQHKMYSRILRDLRKELWDSTQTNNEKFKSDKYITGLRFELEHLMFKEHANLNYDYVKIYFSSEDEESWPTSND